MRDIDERFYNKILTMYEGAAVYVVKGNVRRRISSTIPQGYERKGRNRLGIFKELTEIYYSYFEEQEE
ncbi:MULTISPECIES: hypothetical protein [Pelosinus]|jgi:hypothetical protein|uniref:Uncharacterized protein n=1 Tax=Pelosinus fermentans B4 TaxID=1149862 RepID=I8RGI3_9FIRM|nr:MULTISPECIES: hypothetical protein [Pelosinus]EIW18748.1 hypothetical protein FB4_0273 [Pelosinus fermentans B4]EIW22042.1 hypothetical protein FA11_0849 [Pelosinus fermentans A11]OAM95106.1 hypothetical protein FR7_03127 [Pelosinus fermentans DSM 17108]